MGKIFTIGESLLDIIFKNDQPIAAKAGGAMLNTAVSLGRIGLPVFLISEYGNDRVGQLLDSFLEDNNIRLNYINRFSSGRTALAMAFLDAKNEASYSFYKDYPPERLNIEKPDFSANDIFLFGSFYSVNDDVSKVVYDIASEARTSNALVIYDPNIRTPHKKDIPVIIERIRQNIRISDIVRASDEDFNVIFNASNNETAFEIVSKLGGKVLIYTMNGKGVYLMKQNKTEFYTVPEIKTLSTIGAGDSFNAGLIYGLHKYGIKPNEIEVMAGDTWDELIGYGISFASEVCKSMDNYIPPGFAKSMRD